MKKNPLNKSSQIRTAQKSKTAINNFSAIKKSQQLPSNKMKTSINNNTKRSTNPPESAKPRKSEAITTAKKKSLKTNNIENRTTDKKTSIIKKSEAKSVRKNADKKYNTTVNFKNNVSTSKKNNMSVNLKRSDMDKNKSKTTRVKKDNLLNSFKGKTKSKTAKKPIEVDEIIEEEDKIKSKENLKFKDLKNSQTFNKNESIGINIMNNINDENDNINLDNNIILETENEKNLTDEKDNNTNNINNVKDINQLNSPIQNELIKEKVEGGFINGIINNNLDNKIKNKKVEYSEYISDKNKSTMRNLLYLLEKKPEEKKNQKSLFRASINTLEKREKNKLLDIVYQNRKNIYKTVLENEFKKINSINMVKTPNLVNNINSLNKNDKTAKTPNMETPFLPGNYEDKYQNMKNKYLIMASTPVPRRQYPSFYHDKYFMDYVDGRCPNLCVIERNMKYEKKIHEANLIDTISERHKLNRSFNDKFHFMGKNDLSVEKRDNRYMYYNYKFMVNAIDDKLNGNINDSDFRHSFQPLNKTYSDFHINRGSSESYRNPRISKLYNEINNNIYSVGPESRMRKTVSERNPFL